MFSTPLAITIRYCLVRGNLVKISNGLLQHSVYLSDPCFYGINRKTLMIGLYVILKQAHKLIVRSSHKYYTPTDMTITLKSRAV
jgi:hypothetical protein